MDTSNLTFKQQKFCNEYLVSFNAYRAALLAGYKENTARKAELLQMPKIQTYLREVMNRAAAKAEITHDMILNEYRKIAFANMGNYFDFRGENKRMCELTDDEKAALSYYQIADITESDGFIVGKLCKIKLHNKMAALDRIAKHLNFFKVPADKVSAQVAPVCFDEHDTAEDDAFEAKLVEPEERDADEPEIDETVCIETAEGLLMPVSKVMMSEDRGRMSEIIDDPCFAEATAGEKNPTLSPLVSTGGLELIS